MALFKNISLQQLLKGAFETFRAYPLVLLSAVVGTTALIIRVGVSYEERLQYVYLEKLAMVSALGLILFFTLELLVRRYGLGLRKRVLLWVAGVIFLAVYYYLLPEELQEKQQLRFLLLALALHLIASYAMFFNLREENAFWQFNKSLFLRILTAALYTAVLFLGIALAILAVDNLFTIEVDEHIYVRLWFVLVGVFNTWFFLAGVPTNLQELELSHQYPKGLKVFTQFVLLPLVTLYLVILYLYLGKILIEWEWPHGWVSVLVLWFSIAGILSLLLIYPIRLEEENTWMRTFSKWFYRALFPLIILLMLAIWRRVSEYGITEERYFVMVLALWLFCTALYFLLSSRKNIKFIPVTLSIVALLAAFGPFNAFHVSEWSQLNRLHTILQRNSILVNERIEPARQDIPNEEAREVSSILHYLDRMHTLEEIKPWFRVNVDSALVQREDSLKAQRIYDRNNVAVVMDLMGLDYLQPGYYGGDNFLYFNVGPQRENEVWDVREYDYLLNFGFGLARMSNDKVRVAPQLYQIGDDTLRVTYDLQTETLLFSYLGEVQRVEMEPFYRTLQQRGIGQVPQQIMTKRVEGEKYALKIEWQHVGLERQNKQYRLENMSGRVLLRMKP